MKKEKLENIIRGLTHCNLCIYNTTIEPCPTSCRYSEPDIKRISEISKEILDCLDTVETLDWMINKLKELFEGYRISESIFKCGNCDMDNERDEAGLCSETCEEQFLTMFLNFLGEIKTDLSLEIM